MKPCGEIKLLKQPKELIEPHEDYSLWEKMYGRNLSTTEKMEIESNLIDFFGILNNESKRLSKAQ